MRTKAAIIGIFLALHANQAAVETVDHSRREELTPRLFTLGGRQAFGDGIDVIVDFHGLKSSGTIRLSPIFVREKIADDMNLAAFMKQNDDWIPEDWNCDVVTVVTYDVLELLPSGGHGADRVPPPANSSIMPPQPLEVKRGGRESIREKIGEQLFDAKKVRLQAVVFDKDGVIGRSNSVEVVLD